MAFYMISEWGNAMEICHELMLPYLKSEGSRRQGVVCFPFYESLFPWVTQIPVILRFLYVFTSCDIRGYMVASQAYKEKYSTHWEREIFYQYARVAALY